MQVTETQAPVAGTDGSITVCSTNGPFDLLDVLGGNPDATGTWSDPNGVAVGGVFDPSASLPGSYRYVVPAAAPQTTIPRSPRSMNTARMRARTAPSRSAATTLL